MKGFSAYTAARLLWLKLLDDRLRERQKHRH